MKRAYIFQVVVTISNAEEVMKTENQRSSFISKNIQTFDSEQNTQKINY